MQPTSNGSFGFPCKRGWHFICYVVLFSIVVILFSKSTSNTAHAASISSNPMVAIAVDDTSPSCIITKIVRSHASHKLLSVTHTACPAGTSISITNVPLKQAQAQHETFIMYPPSNSSQRVLARWNAQIQKLMTAKGDTLLPVHKAQVAPAYSCGWDEETSTRDNYRGTWIDLNVYYYLLLNCGSITINREEVVGENPVNTAAYWTDTLYAGWRSHCPMANDFIAARDLAIYPGATQPDRYYNIWQISAGNCVDLNLSQKYSVFI